MTQFLKGVFYIYALVLLAFCALVINQDMANQGKYDQMDQFLYSMAGR